MNIKEKKRGLIIIGQVERHIEGAFGSRHTTTNHGSQLRSTVDVEFTEGGKPENPEKNPRSTGETNSTHMHESQAFWESTRGYTQVVSHSSSYNPARPGLTWNSVAKGNALTTSVLP